MAEKIRHPVVGIKDVVELYKRHAWVEQPPAEASYIVFRIADRYYAKNGDTGEIEFSSGDASEVIQRAIDNAPTGGMVLLRAGTYPMTKTITLKRDRVLAGETPGTTFRATTLRAEADIDILQVLRGSRVLNLDFVAPATLPAFTHSAIVCPGSEQVTTPYPIQIIGVSGYCGKTGGGGTFIKFENTEAGHFIYFSLVSRVWSRNFDYAIRLETVVAPGNMNGNIFSDIFIDGGMYGVYINGTANANLFVGVHMQARDGHVEGIHVDGKYNIFVGCRVWDVPTGTYGVHLVSGSERACFFGGYVKPLWDEGVNNVFIQTTFINRNYGTATLPAGATSVTVSHGLDGTPGVVKVTPRSIAVGACAVTARDATSFTITVETAPAVDVEIDWEAEV